MCILRHATPDDAERIAHLMHLRRLAYEEYQPTFWRIAADATDVQIPYLRGLLAREDTVALIAERDDRSLTGALIATMVPAPPVYAPGGLTCSIDDYWVADPEEWATTGTMLLSQAIQEAKDRLHVAQVVVVCAQLDHRKRRMLEAAGLTVASEWWTRPL